MTSRRITRGIIYFVMMVTAVGHARQSTQVRHLLQNDITALHVVDSVLVAAGNNSIYSAKFETATELFEPFALADYAGPAIQIKKQGQSIVVRSSAGALTFLDATSLPQISILGTVFPPVAYRDFTVSDSMLYLACEFKGVRSYHIAGFSTLTLADSSLEPVHAVAVEVDQGSLYVVDDYTGIIEFQPAGTSIGSATSVVPFNSPATAIAVRNDTLFVGTNGNGTVILTKGESGVAPIDTLPGVFSADRVMLVDTFVFWPSVAEHAADLSSLSGEYNPLFFDSADLIANGAAFGAGGEAYIAWPTTTAGIRLVNLSNGIDNQFERKEANPLGGQISGVLVSDSGVIVTRGSGSTLDCSQEPIGGRLNAAPILPGLGGMIDITQSEGRLYLLSASRDVIAVAGQISDEYALVSLIDLPSDEFLSVAVTDRIHDSLRILAVLGLTSIEVFKVSDNQGVTAVARLYFPEQPLDITTIDSIMVIGSSTATYVYTLDSHLFPSYKSTIYPPPNLRPVVRVLTDPLHSERLIVVGEIGLGQYDLSSPSSPAVVAELDFASSAIDAVQSGEHLYIATRDDGILNISVPYSGNPTTVDSVRLVGNRMDVSGSRVALASEHGAWLIDWNLSSDAPNDEPRQLPLSFRLAQNYPNPFNPETSIEYTLDRPTRTKLTVFNSLGQVVRVLHNGLQQPGIHRVVFDAGDLASGVYLYRLGTPNGADTKKMVLIR
jgi:hypothetical protein